MVFQKGHTTNLGHKHSIKTKHKISETLKSRFFGVIRKGRKHTKEAKKKMSEARQGKNHWNWKGGIRKNTVGYIDIYMPEHPFALQNGYVRRSRLVVEKIIGRYLKHKEVVHHKGIDFPFGSIENKQDDRPKNLQLFPDNGSHTAFHNRKRKLTKNTDNIL